MLEKTNLTDSQKLQLAAASLAQQGQLGAISQLATDFKVSRNTVYQVQAETRSALQQMLSPTDEDSRLWVRVDPNQLARAITGLRVVAPSSLRDIEELIPIVYPGLALSYGTIQAIAAEAENQAALLNGQADLSPIRAAALDEMFSQGKPVLGGVDLDAGYLFLLALREQRRGEDWAEELTHCGQQGLNLAVVVKDAARGIEAGVRAIFEDAEQRDDCFHAHYEMGKVLHRLEQRAYGAIALVDELQTAWDKLRYQGQPKKRCQLAHQLRRARKSCETAIALFDAFEAAQMQAVEAMEMVDLERGILRQPSWMQTEIEAAATTMQSLLDEKCQKVGRYLFNRAAGLASYAQQMNDQLEPLASCYGQLAVILACLMLRLMAELNGRRRAYRRQQDQQQLLGAYAALRQIAGPSADAILSEVHALFIQRHRASSAIEGFNAALRPYLYVHKGVTQGFLELFRFYYNHRQRRWGRHKGTSAHEAMTGQPIDDWLTRLGYPPSTPILN